MPQSRRDGWPLSVVDNSAVPTGLKVEGVIIPAINRRAIIILPLTGRRQKTILFVFRRKGRIVVDCAPVESIEQSIQINYLLDRSDCLLLIIFIIISDHKIGRQQQSCNARSVLEGSDCNLGRVQNASLDHVNVFAG